MEPGRIPFDQNRIRINSGLSAGGNSILPMEINPTTGRLLVDAYATSNLVPMAYDALSYTNTSSTVDTYKYYTGGLSGTLVATVTVTWTDNTKLILVSVVRT